MINKTAMEDTMDSFIKWVGGKKSLRSKILEQFPAAAPDRYVEVFGGAGWVLFARDRHAKMEVFNDINGELINLYRVVKYHSDALQKEIEYLFISREQFYDERDKSLRGMTDIQRAARYYCLIKESFRVDLGSFACNTCDMHGAKDYLSVASDRLNQVIIEHLDFEHIIKTYDRLGALFYLDPPYYAAEKYYEDHFSAEDHIRLRDCLAGIKGKFVLSYNDCPEVRGLYDGYRLITVERQHNLKTPQGGYRYKELIIKNF